MKEQCIRVASILAPHGWQQHHANSWKKRAGRRTAAIIYRANGDMCGSGYLPLLAEAIQLLREAGLIT